jgi:hypothetical protein
MITRKCFPIDAAPDIVGFSRDEKALPACFPDARATLAGWGVDDSEQHMLSAGS